ncbi:hypothetical protein CEK29_07070 [Bordetella genomosp. 5]|uniref:hypothetical protein n=1 Tax=Bordetella genomosp. 5 TaxID=1395608 RepID=UPI000B9EB24A|nr:hypothetical protein [Bordetella genomosp. 5]OZI44486.1 hypothetical protein CEK29_07070 [Bordetella genomosp. 5]
MAVAIEVEALHLASGEVRTLYLATEGHTTRPDDTPANVYFEPRIKRVPGLGRVIFEGAAVYGASRASTGSVELANTDGALDDLVTAYAFDGRRFTVRSGEWTARYADWVVIMSGTLGGVTVSRSVLQLQIKDRLADLDKWDRPTYAGTNVAPNGLEGTADDLKGQVKPRVYGRVANVQGKLVNASKRIYQVSDQACVVSAVYDEGVSLTRGADYASATDLEATPPAAGQFRTYQGYFRLASAPAGVVTADAATAEVRPTQLLRQIAQDGGLAPADISSDVLMNAAPVGVYADSEAAPRALMDAVAASVGAWYAFDRFGVLRMGILTAPSGTPAATWDRSALVSCEIRTSLTPAWRVSLRWGRNYTVQTRLATSVQATPARVSWLAEEYRTAEVKDEAIRTPWPSADELTLDTQLHAQADAEAEAARMFALHSVRRHLVAVQVPVSQLGDVDLSDVVALEYGRYGLNGKAMVVTGIDAGYSSGVAELTLWG